MRLSALIELPVAAIGLARTKEAGHGGRRDTLPTEYGTQEESLRREGQPVKDLADFGALIDPEPPSVVAIFAGPGQAAIP